MKLFLEAVEGGKCVGGGWGCGWCWWWLIVVVALW